MKQTEITVQVFSSVNQIEKSLISQGFNFKERFILKDHYFTNFYKEDLQSKNYKELMENSILVRSVVCDGNEKNQLIFKNKNIDESGNVLSEEKLCTRLNDFDVALKIFAAAKFNNWCDLIQNVVVYKKDNTEICIQNVDGLGVFIEYEEEPLMEQLTEEEKISKMVANLKSLKLNMGEDFSCKKVYMKYCLSKQ